MRSVTASDPTACASRLSVLSTGNHGELTTSGWLERSDPKAPVATNAVPPTSNRTGCGCVGNRHINQAPTAYIGMTTRIQTESENDRPRGDIASVTNSYPKQ